MSFRQFYDQSTVSSIVHHNNDEQQEQYNQQHQLIELTSTDRRKQLVKLKALKC